MLCHVIETLKMATSSAVITVLNLVCKAKAVSPAWDYFGLRADVEGMVSKIRGMDVVRSGFIPEVEEDDNPQWIALLAKLVSSTTSSKGGSTTNLYTHLQDHHPKLYRDVTPHIPKRSRAKALLSEQSHDSSHAKQPTFLQIT